MAIISKIPKASNYFVDNQIFNTIFEYFNRCLESDSIENKRINSLDIGAFDRYYLTEDIFAIEQVFMTKKREKCFIESHKEYIDFQLIISGVEQMEYIDIDKLKIKKEYDEKNDLIIYNMTDETSKIVMEKADIAIFFPDDAHIGLPMHKKEALVRKTVIKLPKKYLQQGFNL